MKKTFKRILTAALALILAGSMLACNTTGDGVESSSPQSSSSSIPDFDYMNEDLSKYVTVGQYKGFELSIAEKPVVSDDDVSLQIDYDLVGSQIVNQITDRAVTEDDTISIDCNVVLAYGQSVVTVAAAIQAAVTAAIESMAGVKVTSVNVNVCGIVRQ